MDCFTDRREAILRFLEYVNVDPLPRKILFFCGDGGNGKSLLLNFLYHNGCKRLSPDNWKKLNNDVGEDDLPKFLKDVDGLPIYHRLSLISAQEEMNILLNHFQRSVCFADN